MKQGRAIAIGLLLATGASTVAAQNPPIESSRRSKVLERLPTVERQWNDEVPAAESAAPELKTQKKPSAVRTVAPAAGPALSAATREPAARETPSPASAPRSTGKLPPNMRLSTSHNAKPAAKDQPRKPLPEMTEIAEPAKLPLPIREKTAEAKSKKPKAEKSPGKVTQTHTLVKQQDVPPPAEIPALPSETEMPAAESPSVAVKADGAPGAVGSDCHSGMQPGPASAGSHGPYVKARAEYRWSKIKYRWQHYWKPGLQEHHWGYPEEFCEKPLGYYVFAHARTEVANGEAARMMLYNYDFVPGEATLNNRGREQLAKAAFMLPRNFFPLIIEDTPETPGLAEDRQKMVVGYLQQSNFPVPAERIVVGTAISNGIFSTETERVGNNFLLNVDSRGGLAAPLSAPGQGGTTTTAN